MKTFRVGIDNYGLYPLKLSPLDTLRWAKDHGAEGVAFSGLEVEDSKKIDEAYLNDLKQFADDHDLYIEWGGAQHIPRDMTLWAQKDILEVNRRVAGEAKRLETRIVRSCSGGLMRWNPDSPPTDILLQETAEALKAQHQMLKDHNVILAIETHFEFTTFELLRLFERCEAEPGDYLGICLDTMNLLVMLEDPVAATERILPWVVSTHIKDGVILLNSEGLLAFPSEIGAGVVNLGEIIRRLGSLPWEIHLSAEDHGGDFFLPIFNPRFLSKFPDLTTQEFARLMQLVQRSQDKVNSSECGATQRDRWAEVCEERMKRDVLTLRSILASL